MRQQALCCTFTETLPQDMYSILAGRIDTLPEKRYTILKKEVHPMKKYDLYTWVSTFSVPVLQILLGAIMLLRPDSATSLIARCLGWVLVIAGGISAAPMLSGRQTEDDKAKQFLSVTVLALGIWLLCNPMLLASALGRLLGVLLLIANGRRMLDARRYKQPLPLLACICAGIGLILVLVPLSASRLAISLVGLVLVAIGIAEVFDRLKGKRYLEQGDDPNIIDAL